MNEKIAIKTNSNNNLLKVIIDYFETEKIDYITNPTEISSDIKTLIYLGENQIDTLPRKTDLSIVMITDKKTVIDTPLTINYIITNLIHDETKYTDVQNEYLLKQGIYHIFLEKLNELIENINNYNGMIYDLTELKSIPNNWIFSFDSINDTYSWLSKKNKMLPNDLPRKVINFYADKVYDDSIREINYLTEKLMEIKEGKNIIDIFICTKEELSLFRKNYFFKLLLKNISDTYRFCLIDKEELLENDRELIMKLTDGIAIYNDCVYRDTYDDEFSLGYVDCNASTLKEYNDYFDYILNRYGKEIRTESDLDGI